MTDLAKSSAAIDGPKCALLSPPPRPEDSAVPAMFMTGFLFLSAAALAGAVALEFKTPRDQDFQASAFSVSEPSRLAPRAPGRGPGSR